MSRYAVIKGLLRVLLMTCIVFGTGCTSMKSGAEQQAREQQAKKSKIAPEDSAPAAGIDVLQDMMRRAEVFYKTREYAQSKALYLKAIEIDPKNLQALYRLGNIAFRSRDWTGAMNWYTQVIELEPKHVRAQHNLAMTHLTLAERHLKFYAAHVDSDANLESVSKLIRVLEEIANPVNVRGPQPSRSNQSVEDNSALDKLLFELSR